MAGECGCSRTSFFRRMSGCSTKSSLSTHKGLQEQCWQLGLCETPIARSTWGRGLIEKVPYQLSRGVPDPLDPGGQPPGDCVRIGDLEDGWGQNWGLGGQQWASDATMSPVQLSCTETPLHDQSPTCTSRCLMRVSSSSLITLCTWRTITYHKAY